MPTECAALCSITDLYRGSNHLCIPEVMASSREVVGISVVPDSAGVVPQLLPLEYTTPGLAGQLLWLSGRGFLSFI